MDPNDQAIRGIKLHDLRLLVAVERWGGMAKAASRLNISQSSVSKTIAAMEYALGVRLLDRNPQGVEFTVYGRELLACAGAVFDELHQGVKRLEFLADPAVGELRIGSTEPLVAGLVTDVLDRLCGQYPQITFHVTQADIVALRDHELRERKVDLIIGRMPTSFAEDPSIDVVTLFREQLFVIAGKDSKWAHRRKIELSDLIDEPWAFPPSGSAVGSFMAEAFRANGLEPPQPRVICFSFLMHNALIATGHFLSMASGSALRFGAKRLSFKILPIELHIPARTVGIITLKNRTISPVAKLFIECAREVAKPLTDGKYHLP
jgi:DNA-binding transcriptional LysR family regulator